MTTNGGELYPMPQCPADERGEEVAEEEKSGEICSDDRFLYVSKFLERLKESTNIETSPDEMAVIENILFRFWQLGWLQAIEKAETGRWVLINERIGLYGCPVCGQTVSKQLAEIINYCPVCGTKMQLEEEGT